MMNCQDIENSIESYVDGDLEAGIREQIKEHIAHCQECEVTFKLAVQIRDELGLLPKYSCPDSVIQKVTGRLKDERKGWLSSLRPVRLSFRPRYALGFAAAVLIIAVTIMTLNHNSLTPWFHEGQHHYTQQEIAMARQNILLAFGYVHYAANRTQQVIEEDVLPRRVVRPIQKSLEHMHLNKEKGESS